MHYAGIDEVAGAIRSGAVSPTEVLELVLARIDQLDPTLHSYASVMADTARAQAAAATQEVRARRWQGPLHGIPIAVKDLYGTLGAPTTFGSRHLQHHVLPEDAEAVRRLRAAGAVIVGKLRMSEAALTDHGVGLPVPVNPWDPDTWVGTSSSGCAAATAAGLCFGSLGSDTGGSIRGPSTATGLTGLKTTRGAIPTAGTLPLSRSLDTLGPFARSARDCRILFDVIAGRDSERTAPGGCGRPTVRMGVDPHLLETVSAGTRNMIEATAGTFADLGVEIVEVSVPDGARLAADWVVLVGAEALTDLAELYPTEAEVGPEVRHVLREGAGASPEQLEQIRGHVGAYTVALDRVLAEVDALLLPTIAAPSPTLADVARMRLDYDVWNRDLMRLTAPVNFSGHPSLALPTGFGNRRTPWGAQLVGRHDDEGMLLELGELFQTTTDFHTRRPPLYP